MQLMSSSLLFLAHASGGTYSFKIVVQVVHMHACTHARMYVCLCLCVCVYVWCQWCTPPLRLLPFM